jgi:hypothetical protein
LQTADAMANRSDRLLWGRIVERLPQNTFGLQLDYFYQRFDGAFDNRGNAAGAIQPIDIHDPFGGKGRFLEFKADERGRRQTIDLRFSYGVTDDWLVFVNAPLLMQNGWLIYDFRPGTSSRLGVRTLNGAFGLFREFGRPTPTPRFHDTGWNWGDVEGGAEWTYYDAAFLTLTAQFGVIAPSGRTANPNAAQRFGFGAQIDEGLGAVAPTVTQRVHVPFPKPVAWMGFTGEATLDYYLPAHRFAPQWGQPNPQAAELRRTLGLDGDDRFLDLSKVSRDYTLTTGAHVEAMGALTFQFAYLSAGLGYIFDARQAPYVDADPLWKRFFRASDSYPTSDSHTLALQVGVPLLPLRLPGLLDLGYQFGVGGRNTLNFDNAFALQIMFALPLE